MRTVALGVVAVAGLAGMLCAQQAAPPVALAPPRGAGPGSFDNAAAPPATQRRLTREEMLKAQQERMAVMREQARAREAERLVRRQDLLDNLTDARVVESMKRGTDALLELVQEKVANTSKERTINLGDGRVIKMPINTETETGELCMGIYALLTLYRATGDERLHFTSKEMAPAIKKLCEINTDHTYSMALQANALALLPNKPEFRKPLERVRETLLRGARTQGGYSYHSPKANDVFRPGGSENYDNSNTQYGLLGVWAAADAGLEIPLNYWKISDTHWRKTQQNDGGWSYIFHTARPNVNIPNFTPSTMSMTAAGVASLFLVLDQMDSAVRLDPVPDRPLEAGLEWLAKQFEKNGSTVAGRDLYTAFGLERVGLASGLKYFGKVDWYREVTATVLSEQSDDGTWKGQGFVSQPVPATSYALLFLARGRSPVVFTKLSYKGPWNARARDVAKLNRWLMKRTERYVNWQVVDVDTQPDDWLDGPVLVITGHGDPGFTPEQVARLKRYTQAGGLILSCADGEDGAFTNAIRQKYAPAICDRQYEMRKLPADHYVYTMDYKVPKGKEQALSIWGLSNGSRELWVHCPKDFGAAWQRNATVSIEAFEIPTNLYFYVSGRASLRSRLDPLTVKAPAAKPARSLTVARLKYPGNWDPEPGAWERFAKIAALKHDTALTVLPATCAELDPAKTPVVHLTGTAAFVLPEEDTARLRAYLSAGGFLVVDANGGSEAFSQSARAVLARAMPDVTLVEAPRRDHPVATGNFVGGRKLEELDLRRFAHTGAMRDRRAPIMEYKLGGRTVALLFEGDVSSGLLGTNTWGIFGYTPAVSEALAWNAITWRGRDLKPAPPAEPVPAESRPAEARPGGVLFK